MVTVNRPRSLVKLLPFSWAMGFGRSVLKIYKTYDRAVFFLRAVGWQGKSTELHTALLAVVIALANTSVFNLDCTLQSLKEALKYTDFHPRDSDLIGLGNDLSIWIFNGYPGDSMCILRPTSWWWGKSSIGFTSWLSYFQVGWGVTSLWTWWPICDNQVR